MSSPPSPRYDHNHFVDAGDAQTPPLRSLMLSSHLRLMLLIPTGDDVVLHRRRGAQT